MSLKPGEFTDAEEPRSRPAYCSRCPALSFLLLSRNAVVVQEMLPFPTNYLKSESEGTRKYSILRMPNLGWTLLNAFVWLKVVLIWTFLSLSVSTFSVSLQLRVHLFSRPKLGFISIKEKRRAGVGGVEGGEREGEVILWSENQWDVCFTISFWDFSCWHWELDFLGVKNPMIRKQRRATNEWVAM